MYDPLAQLAEHLTFNQGVWSSNLQWVIPICLPKRVVCGRGGMADAPDLGSGAPGRMSSSLIVRTVSFAPQRNVEHAVVAQLVERHLAKVEVAGPSPVYRSTCGCSSMAELQPSKLATRVRFPSPAPEERQIASKRRPVGWRFHYAQMADAATSGGIGDAQHADGLASACAWSFCSRLREGRSSEQRKPTLAWP